VFRRTEFSPRHADLFGGITEILCLISKFDFLFSFREKKKVSYDSNPSTGTGGAVQLNPDLLLVELNENIQIFFFEM
jgi:hypothetical protein